jgi:hypothetical protein
MFFFFSSPATITSQVAVLRYRWLRKIRCQSSQSPWEISMYIIQLNEESVHRGARSRTAPRVISTTFVFSPHRVAMMLMVFPCELGVSPHRRLFLLRALRPLRRSQEVINFSVPRPTMSSVPLAQPMRMTKPLAFKLSPRTNMPSDTGEDILGDLIFTRGAPCPPLPECMGTCHE